MKSVQDIIDGAKKELTSIHGRIGSILQSIMSLQTQKEETAEEPADLSAEEHDEERQAVAEDNGQIEGDKGVVKVNKSKLVRTYLDKLGDKVRNKDVIAAIKKDTGLEVPASLVSLLRSKGVKKAEKPSKKASANGKVTKGKVWTSKVVSGSALIRQYLETHGIDSSNDEVVKSIKKTKGVEVKPTLVSTIRANMKSKGAKTSKVKAPKMKIAAVKKGGRGPTMTAVVVSVLSKSSNGLELSQVAEKALKSGYKYRGKKDLAGFTQNVYQALHTLSKKIPHPGYKGKVAVVIHEGHLYKLNPKAAKEKVA